jgi:hypothetical protein
VKERRFSAAKSAYQKQMRPSGRTIEHHQIKKIRYPEGTRFIAQGISREPPVGRNSDPCPLW